MVCWKVGEDSLLIPWAFQMLLLFSLMVDQGGAPPEVWKSGLTIFSI
jgi:hypothetical protein